MRDLGLCPVPLRAYPKIMLAHGGGGRLMHQLIDQVFVAAFDNPHLRAQHDSSVVTQKRGKLAFTTDSYVVRPLFFPGGDIGSLAVHGTVNDLAMSGARPEYLSAAFILEEGLPMETLWKIVCSMREAADRAGVQIITGDTKVVDKGKGDGVFITTSGVGFVEHEQVIGPASVREGDLILINGDVARHGIAIMSKREGLEFESEIESDSAALNGMVREMLDAGVEIHCMRDLTRGGLATALNEIAVSARLGISVDEKSIPVLPDVRGACEILGFDPLYVANEGRMIAFVPSGMEDKALSIMKGHSLGRNGAIIGRVSGRAESESPRVVIRGILGAPRVLDLLSGEQLPRIC